MSAQLHPYSDGDQGLLICRSSFSSVNDCSLQCLSLHFSQLPASPELSVTIKFTVRMFEAQSLCRHYSPVPGLPGAMLLIAAEVKRDRDSMALGNSLHSPLGLLE